MYFGDMFVEMKKGSGIMNAGQMCGRSYHGTNAVCGCWSECVVVGVGSVYSSVTEIHEITGWLK